MTTTLKPQAIRAQLREVAFLDGLTDGDFHFLSTLVAPAEFAVDELLFEEGQARSRIVFLVSGSVAIEKRGAGAPVRLSSLGAGEAVGEGLLLDDSPHGTTARALEPTTA